MFRSVLLLFDLLSEFRQASGMAQHKEPGTLRSQVFLCGAELEQMGDDTTLLLSTVWGGLSQPGFLIDCIYFNSEILSSLPDIQQRLPVRPFNTIAALLAISIYLDFA